MLLKLLVPLALIGVLVAAVFLTLYSNLFQDKNLSTKASYTETIAKRLSPNVDPLLKVFFNGTFASNDYAPGTGEVVKGTLVRTFDSETINQGEIALTSKEGGLRFLPSSPIYNSSNILNKNLIIEVVARQSGKDMTYETLLSALGSVFYRYKYNSQDSMEFGFEGPVAPWHQKTASISAFSPMYQHAALVYTYTDPKSASLSLYINGCKVSETITNTVTAAGHHGEGIGFGRDVHPRAPKRGWEGSIDAVAASTFTDTFSTVDHFQILPGISHKSPLAAIAPCDNQETLVQKAANIVPTQNQRNWHNLELTSFIHFGVNTFTGKEWGNGLEDPKIFNPTQLNAEQWITSLKSGEFKSVIMVAKHLDGFSLWPTRYSTHSVKASPWKNGTGNVVGDVAAATKRNNMKLGIYYGLIDLHEANKPGGIFGNKSASVKTTIPTLLPGDTRRPTKTFVYNLNDYHKMMLNQLYELLTENGPVSEVWLDTAGPVQYRNLESFNYPAIFDLVHHLAPDAVIFLSSVRWVGNEKGEARPNEWNVVPMHADPFMEYRGQASDLYTADIGSQSKWAGKQFFAYYPTETDTSIRPGWFYRSTEDSQVKSLAVLKDFYFNSVGRNGNALLNVPPDKRGLFTDADVQRLKEFGNWVRTAFQKDLAKGSRATSTNTIPNPLHPETNVVDGDPNTYWQMDEDRSTGEITINMGSVKKFNRILLQESMDVGQRIESYAVEYLNGGAWVPVTVVSSPMPSAWPTEDPTRLGTIGYKRILRINPVSSDQVRVKVLNSRLSPSLSTISLYYE